MQSREEHSELQHVLSSRLPRCPCSATAATLLLDDEVFVAELDASGESGGSDLGPTGAAARAQLHWRRAQQLLGALRVGEPVGSGELVSAHVFAKGVRVQPVQRDARRYPRGRRHIQAVELCAPHHLSGHGLELLQQHALLQQRRPHPGGLRRAERSRRHAEAGGGLINCRLHLRIERHAGGGGDVCRTAREVDDGRLDGELYALAVQRAKVGEQRAAKVRPAEVERGCPVVHACAVVIRLQGGTDQC
mmetsp:Transcript_6996/g.17912  ORF Transcript_6996/g.17912 Transcript_6996/m.17912 type:complete len:248 (+) Transcript_6996:297-1040(+)